MATNVRIVTGTLPVTAGGTADFTISGFGTVQAALLFANDANTTNNPEAHGNLSVGFWDGTNQYGQTIMTEDASSVTDPVQRIDTGEALPMLSTASVALRGWAVSNITDGVRLTLSVGATTGLTRYVTIVLINGITAAACGVQDMGTGTSGLNITSLGSRADLVFAATHGGNGTDVTGTVSARMSFGAAHIAANDTVSQGLVSFHEVESSADGDARTLVRNDAVVVDQLNGSESWRATISPHASGFTITPNANASNADVIYLALELADPADAYVGVVDSKTSTGTQAYTGTGFTPLGLILAQSVVTTVNTETTVGFLGIGAADSSAQRMSGICSEYGSATTDTEAFADLSNVLHIKFDTGADDAIAALDSLDSDGWTLNYSDGSASARKMLAIAIGDSTAGGSVWNVAATEAASTDAIQSATAVVIAARIEDAASTEIVAATYAAVASLTEAVSTDDIAAATYAAVASLTEAASTDDIVAAGAAGVASVTEQVAATDLQTSIATWVATIVQDVATSSIEAADISVAASVVEAVAAASLQSATSLLVASALESVAATDTIFTPEMYSAAVTEFVTVSDIVRQPGANWVVVNTTQAPGWGAVTTAQLSGWTPVNTQ